MGIDQWQAGPHASAAVGKGFESFHKNSHKKMGEKKCENFSQFQFPLFPGVLKEPPFDFNSKCDYFFIHEEQEEWRLK